MKFFHITNEFGYSFFLSYKNSTVQLFWNLFIYRYNEIGMFSETMWLSSKITEMLASKLIPKADVFLEASKVDREC